MFGLFDCSNLMIQLPSSYAVMLHVVAASSLLFGAGLLPLFFYKGKEHQEHPCFQFVLRLDRFTYSVYLLYTCTVYLLYTYHALCTYCTVYTYHALCTYSHTCALCIYSTQMCKNNKYIILFWLFSRGETYFQTNHK